VAIFTTLTYCHDVLKILLSEESFLDLGGYYLFAHAQRDNLDIYHLMQHSDELAEYAQKIGMKGRFVKTVGYPAPFFVPMSFFTLFEYKYVKFIWLVLNNLLLISSIVILMNMVLNKITIGQIAITSFMVFIYQPLFEDIAVGQINLTIFFLIILSLYLYTTNRHILSGAILVLPVFIKFYCGFLLMYFIFKRKFRILFGSMVTFILVCGISILLLGIETNISYLEYFLNYPSVFHTITPGFNHSISAMFYRIFSCTGNSTFQTVSGVILLLIFGIFTVYITKRDAKDNNDFLIQFSLFVTAIFMINPFVEEHHFILLYLPFLVIWYNIEKLELFDCILYVTSFLLIALKYSFIQFPIFHKGLLSIIASGKTFGFIILYILLARLLKTKFC